MRKILQSSTATFRDVIEGGYLYVDKTRSVYELVRESKGIYFLSRPRRFGKSLLVSTLEEIFHGNRVPFEGLWIDEQDYTWDSYPVIRLDFSVNSVRSVEGLEEFIDYEIQQIASKYALDEPLAGFNYVSRFRELILKLSQINQSDDTAGKIVILIDEYDKPLTDNLENTEEALRIQKAMRAFYSVIKGMDEHLRFVFITGISKFSKVGVFSTMNNLTDLTMSPRFATMLGLTEAELRENFQPYIADLAAKEALSEDEFIQKMATWYDGFRFTRSDERVYNTYSVLNLFFHETFSNFWFESGTPRFLIQLLKEKAYDIESLDGLEVEELAFSTFEVHTLAIIPLLFQTGYLTIKNFYADDFGSYYTLSYPNTEVKNAFVSYLLSAYNQVEVALTGSHLRHLLQALHAKDLPRFFEVLQIFFANVDYKIYIKQEKYYQTIFYLIFLLLGVRIKTEIETNDGRIDAVIELADHIFLFEFKLDGTKEEALKQIRDHDYARKYRLQGKPITLVGANFSSGKRTIIEWKDEPD